MTLAAVPSTNPVDFLLNVETLDTAINSNELTFTDRLGNSKSTLGAAIDSIKSFTDRGAWTALTVYAGKDLVSNGGTWYVCVVPHTSSAAFATDTASKWRVYQGVIAGDLAASSGAGLVMLNVALSYPLGSLGDAAIDVISPRNSPYNAVGDGVTDDTAALISALTSGKKIIDGGGRVYKTTAQITVPEGIQFRNAKIQMGDSNYLGVAYNTDSEIYNVRVTGTSRTNQYPASQRGIGAASAGRTNVKIDAIVENCNINFDHNGTKFSVLRMRSKNASGLSGISEGYAALLYQGATDNHVNLISEGDARHSLYLSSGASRNHCVVTSSGVVTSYAVQINCQRDQLPCRGNIITGTDYNSAGGVAIAMQTTANADTGGTVQDNIVHDFVVYAEAATNLYPAFIISMPSEILNASNNGFVNCKARGTYNSTTLGICHVSGGKSRRVLNMDIEAISANTTTGGFVVQPSYGGGVDHFDDLTMDLLTSAVGVLGSYFQITSGNYTFENPSITCASGTKVFFSGAAESYMIGSGNSWSTNAVSASIPATTLASVVVTLPSNVALGTKIQATIISQGVSASSNSSVQLGTRTGTSATFYVYNGHSAAQVIVFSVAATGLPG